MTALKKIIVAEYSEQWPLIFEDLKQVYILFLGDDVIDIQHVGSTSVPGLAAKPTIDIDLVIPDKKNLNTVIFKLQELGYEYQGDLGIEDRESFRRTSDQTPLDGSGRTWQKHNLYCCTKDSISLKNHMQFRDSLRKHPEKVKAYSELKKRLVDMDPFDAAGYTTLKTPFITDTLREAGFDPAALDRISEQNKFNLR